MLSSPGEVWFPGLLLHTSTHTWSWSLSKSQFTNPHNSPLLCVKADYHHTSGVSKKSCRNAQRRHACSVWHPSAGHSTRGEEPNSWQCCHVQLNCECDVGVVDRSRRRGHLQIEGAVNHTLHSIKGLEGTAGFFSAHSNVDVRTLAGLPVCLSAHLFTHAHPAAPAEAHEFCHRRYVARPLVSTRAVRTALLTLTQHCTAKSVLIAIGFCAGPVKLVSGGHAGRVPLPNGLIQVRLKTTTVLSWSLAGLLSSWFSCTEASLSPGVVPTAWNS